MTDTYYVEERSGVIGLGPLRTSPEIYYRNNKTNWRSSTSWIHLIICLLAVPLIIWNLFLLMDTIINYSQISVNPTAENAQYTAVHPLGLLIVLSAILMNLLLGLIGLVVLFLLIACYGVGFWRFSIISAIYLNDEGPTWFKPLLYGCLAAIPLLTTSSQCRDTKNVVGCLPNELFGGRTMYNDFVSFTIMTIIAVISAIPFLLGISHNEN